jgi:ATP-binding cassette subfamily B protein
MKPSAKPSAGAWDVLRIYVRSALMYPGYLAATILGSAGIEVAQLIQPLFLRQFFNGIAGGNTSDATIHTLEMAIVYIALCGTAGWASRRIMSVSASKIDALVMQKLQLDAFEYITKHSYTFFANNFAGSLTHKISRFSRSYENIFDTVIMNFMPTMLYIFGAIGILYVHNHTLGLILLAWTIVFIAFQVWYSRHISPVRRARSEADTKLTGAISDTISNHTTMFVFAGAAHEKKLLKAASDDWLTKTLRLWMFENNVWGGFGIMMIGINAVLLYGALVYWRQGLLTVGDFILIQSYLMGTFGMVTGISRQLRTVNDSISDAGEMVAILQTPHEIADTADAPNITVTSGAITLQNISFYFNKKKPILSKLNLKIPGHQKVALVGPSGAGKSTITKLLLRFYDTKAGSISIDGQNIAHVTQDSLREAIAYVPQEPILFHRTLMDNIRYGKRDATDKEVIEAAKSAHCHEFISQLPEKYNTFVGERGIKLSGGERQRVAIARAILKNAPILILDEATSSLDSESEALIQDALNTLMRGKTVMVIAHRLSTIMKMDRIVVLEGGQVVADGTHDELVSQGGLYHKLWSIQAGGFVVDVEPATDEALAQE